MSQIASVNIWNQLTGQIQDMGTQISTAMEEAIRGRYECDYNGSWYTSGEDVNTRALNKLIQLHRDYQMEHGKHPWYWDEDFFHTIEDPARDPNFRYPYDGADDFRVGPHHWHRRRVRVAVAHTPVFAVGSENAIMQVPMAIEEWVIATNGNYTEFRHISNGVEVEVFRFEYAWCCDFSRARLPGRGGVTGQFAPICEFQEVQPEDYIAWENHIIGDEHYRLMQEQAQLILLRVTNETPMWTEREERQRFHDSMYRIVGVDPAVVHPKKTSTEDFKSPLYCIADITPPRRAELLLKEWLTDNEYAALIADGELAIPSQHEKDTIYIVKRNPQERVRVKKKGIDVQELCIVPTAHDVPQADNLLAKILFLKSDEKKFVEMAGKFGPNISNSNPGRPAPQYDNPYAAISNWYQVPATGTQFIDAQTYTAQPYPAQAFTGDTASNTYIQTGSNLQPTVNAVTTRYGQHGMEETEVTRQIRPGVEEITTYHNGNPIRIITRVSSP